MRLLIRFIAICVVTSVGRRAAIGAAAGLPVELQATAEKTAFDDAQMSDLLALGKAAQAGQRVSFEAVGNRLGKEIDPLVIDVFRHR